MDEVRFTQIKTHVFLKFFSKLFFPVCHCFYHPLDFDNLRIFALHLYFQLLRDFATCGDLIAFGERPSWTWSVCQLLIRLNIFCPIDLPQGSLLVFWSKRSFGCFLAVSTAVSAFFISHNFASICLSHTRFKLYLTLLSIFNISS